MPELPQLLLVASMTTLAGLLQGSLGFGWALLCTPGLLWIDPAYVPAPPLLASTVLVALMALREREAIDVSAVCWAVAGRVPGAALAALLVQAVSVQVLGRICGGAVLLGVALSLGAVRLRPAPPSLFAAGMVSGFMGTACSVGGPAMALLYQAEAAPRVRATLSSFFLAGALISCVALGAVGRLGVQDLMLAATLLPGLCLGLLLSGPLRGRLNADRLRRGVLVVAGGGGLLVLLR